MPTGSSSRCSIGWRRNRISTARASACLGRSFGGYWATKLAHLHPERIAGAVNWGGGAHYMFQRDWVEASRYPDSYLMELVETRQRMLGASNDAEYVEFFERLSLLEQEICSIAVRTAAARERQGRQAVPDRRHAPADRTRQPEVRAPVPGRAHGPHAADAADDRRRGWRASCKVKECRWPAQLAAGHADAASVLDQSRPVRRASQAGPPGALSSRSRRLHERDPAARPK